MKPLSVSARRSAELLFLFQKGSDASVSLRVSRAGGVQNESLTLGTKLFTKVPVL